MKCFKNVLEPIQNDDSMHQNFETLQRNILYSFTAPSSLTLCNTKSQELRWNLWLCCGSAAALVGVWT